MGFAAIIVICTRWQAGKFHIHSYGMLLAKNEKLVFQMMISLEHTSRHRLHPIVHIKFITELSRGESDRSRMWVDIGRELQTQIARRLLEALDLNLTSRE